MDKEALLSSGFYLAIEGPSRAGKTTQREMLEALWRNHYPAPLVITREPGSWQGQSQIADNIRDIVQAKKAQSFKERMNFWTEACLYAASRSQTLRTIVLPALKAGQHVISDRTFISSMAFQGGGRELGIENVLKLNLPAVTAWSMPKLNLDWESVIRGEIAQCIYDDLIATSHGDALDPMTEAYLYMACQAQETGKADFLPGMSLVDGQDKSLIIPNLVLHLDIRPEVIVERTLDSAGDKFEALGPDFHARVRQAYFDCRGLAPYGNWVTVNGEPDPATVFSQIEAGIKPFLPQS